MTDAPLGQRPLPARQLAVADTVSPAVAAAMRVPLAEREALLHRAPTEPGGWPAYVAEIEASEHDRLALLKQQFGVEIELGVVAGVTVRTITPPTIDRDRADWLLIHMHGGAYVTGGGEIGTTEAILTAHRARARVISIDYRMPPDHPFPAAVDDTTAVWESLCDARSPNNMAFFGTSTGGALCVATALAAKQRGLPMPAALAPSTPWSDLTETGDSYNVNRHIDGAVPFYQGLLERAALLYAGPNNLKHPLASPIYGDLEGLPPTILTTGTRDLFLSCTVRLHRAMRGAGVEASLHVFEGISHGELNGLHDSPESLDAFREVAMFLERHLNSGAP